MDGKVFEFIRELVRERSAIVLGEGKEYLVEARLKPLCRAEGFTSIELLVEALRRNPLRLVTLVVEALTTNETSFFRDIRTFESVRDVVLPEIISHRTSERALDIWCGASSSGQEPLSIAILIRESFPELANWRVRILGTDLNEAMLERCRTGEYSQLEIARGLPDDLRNRYFRRAGAAWKATPEILGMVEYRQLNLASRFTVAPRQDIVFLRNVLIYFDASTKAEILKRVSQFLAPDGVLLLGTAESTVGFSAEFQPRPLDKATCFQRA